MAVTRKDATSSEPLKVLVLPELKVSDIDPARIVFNQTWGYLENLTQPLVEWSPDGQLRAGVAKSWEWVGDELHMHIQDNYRTVDGLRITADDAAFSLKRVIVMARNTHGFIADFLCGDHAITNVDDNCPGIVADGNTLKLRPIKGKAFLLKMLTAMDFAILLRSQVDPKTLEIQSFRNSTGPYHLDLDASGQMHLSANTSHWRYSDKMPQKITYIPADRNRRPKDPTLRLPFEMYLDGEIDVLQNFTTDRAELYPVTAKRDGKSILTPTVEIGRLMAVFTPRGMRELLPERRIAVGKALRRVIADVQQQQFDGSKPTEEFFATFGDGGLQPDELSQLRQKFASVAEDKDGEGISVALSTSMLKIEHALQFQMPKAHVDRSAEDYANGKTGVAEPHIVIAHTDSGWTEDLGLLAYSINMQDFFPGATEEGKKWLLHYAEVEDKEQRMKLLRELHYRALAEPWLIPIAAEPYYTLTRSPWTYQGPKLFNSGALWHLRRP